jgi:hypothetical protein
MGWSPPRTGGGGAQPSPSGTVVSETSFGQATAVGSSPNYSRADHTHGTPSPPTGGGFTGSIVVCCSASCSGTNTLTVSFKTLTFGAGVLQSVSTCGSTTVSFTCTDCCPNFTTNCATPGFSFSQACDDCTNTFITGPCGVCPSGFALYMKTSQTTTNCSPCCGVVSPDCFPAEVVCCSAVYAFSMCS